MTIDDYNKARDLVIKIAVIQGKIYDLKEIIRNNTDWSDDWLMEVRPNTAHPSKKVDHYGLLPEFLQAVLSKHLEELHKLQSELDEL